MAPAGYSWAPAFLTRRPDSCSGLLDFSSSTRTVAITGGTDDYLAASEQLQFNQQDYVFTIVTH
jgi:hypothetical protein